MPKTYLSAIDREYARYLREIHGFMKEKRLTLAELSGCIAKDRTTLGKKLRGEVPLTLMEYLTIMDALK